MFIMKLHKEIESLSNSDRPNDLNLKYQRFTPSGCRDKVIGNFEFVAKTKILLENLENYPKGKVVLELILVQRKARSK